MAPQPPGTDKLAGVDRGRLATTHPPEIPDQGSESMVSQGRLQPGPRREVRNRLHSLEAKASFGVTETIVRMGSGRTGAPLKEKSKLTARTMNRLLKMSASAWGRAGCTLQRATAGQTK
jgi:hypothetical protein